MAQAPEDSNQAGRRLEDGTVALPDHFYEGSLFVTRPGAIGPRGYGLLKVLTLLFANPPRGHRLRVDSPGTWGFFRGAEIKDKLYKKEKEVTSETNIIKSFAIGIDRLNERNLEVNINSIINFCLDRCFRGGNGEILLKTTTLNFTSVDRSFLLISGDFMPGSIDEISGMIRKLFHIMPQKPQAPSGR